MKKLLIFMLVLGMTSMASAVPVDILGDIELVLEGTTVRVVGLDTALTWKQAGIYVATGEPGTVGPPLNDYVAAGDLRDITQWAGYNGVDITVDPGMGSPLELGLWFDFQLTGVSPGVMVKFDIFNYTEPSGQPPYADAVGYLYTIPEPMTVLLLGLGGLFLRRRK